MRIALYVGRRFLLLIPQIFLISFVTFVLVRLLPGDPARLQLGPLAPEPAVQALRERLLLDQPLTHQYVAYLGRLFEGDFGQSWVNGTAVSQDLIERVPVTLELIIVSLIVVFAVLAPLAVVTASVARHIAIRFFQNVAFVYGMLAGALPDFLLGLLAIFFFFTLAGILPGPEGRLGLLDIPPPFVTGFLLIDCLIAGDFATLGSAVKHMILPVFTLAFVYGAPIFKMLRSRTEEALRADYTTYAEVIGLPSRLVFLRAMRVASGPTIVMTGVVSGFLLGGAVLVETVFNMNGLGQYAVQAITTADYAAIQGFVLVAAIFTMLVYLAVDLVYFAVDPRVKLGATAR